MKEWMPSPELAAHFGLIFVIFNMLVLSAAFMVWMERKVCAYIQDRVGPNRVGFEGVLQPFADVAPQPITPISTAMRSVPRDRSAQWI